MPFVSKAAHRYMQFDPDTYKAQDHKFIPCGSLGLIAREYEVTQLVQLLQTMPADAPTYPMLIESIVEAMNLTNREGILNKIKEANTPNPEAQQMQMQQQQMQMQAAQGELQKLYLEIGDTK
jgi:ATP-dependent RNA circularization protein (DNA/RNA ligase family)